MNDRKALKLVNQFSKVHPTFMAFGALILAGAVEEEKVAFAVDKFLWTRTRTAKT
jgi:hypothetical protein